MQKKIIALAIAAAFAAPVAMADTANVNIYGTIDAGLRSDSATGNRLTTFGSGSFNANRWGIKGSEDLGDGMKAFWGLESNFSTSTGQAGGGSSAQGVPTGTGNPLFDRNATVGVSSGANAIELGRQRIVAHKLKAAIDPLAAKFRSQSNFNTSYSTANRLNNLVSYTGSFGDVKVMADRDIPASGVNDLATTSLGAVYASGPINVTAAVSRTDAAGEILSPTAYYLVGGSYSFGDAKVAANISQNKVATTVAVDTVTKNQSVGGSYNVSPKIAVLAGFYRTVNNTTVTQDTTTSRLIVAATYALSKRTTAYANLDKRSVNPPLGNTISSKGGSLGLATTF